MNFLPELIAAMILVESGGDPNAVGDGGRALGCLQIHASVVQDVNRVYKTSFRHVDAFNPRLSRKICELYLRHYATPACQGVAPQRSLEILARIWNGGPRGHLKPATKIYWENVKAKMGGGNERGGKS